GADGLAKRAVYGGVERQRLSSQSVKAHLRVGTGINGSMNDLATALGTEMSVRSALIGPKKIKPSLEGRGLSSEEASAWAEAIMALFRTGKEKGEGQAAAPKKGKKAAAETEEDEEEEAAAAPETAEAAGRQVLTLGTKEIDALTTVAATFYQNK